MSPSNPNRREAMQKIGAVFMGAVSLGGTAFIATNKYQRELAEQEIDAILAEYPSARSKREDLLKNTQEQRDHISRSYGMVGAALGAAIGTEHHDWELPNRFGAQID